MTYEIDWNQWVLAHGSNKCNGCQKEFDDEHTRVCCSDGSTTDFLTHINGFCTSCCKRHLLIRHGIEFTYIRRRGQHGEGGGQ